MCIYFFFFLYPGNFTQFPSIEKKENYTDIRYNTIFLQISPIPQKEKNSILIYQRYLSVYLVFCVGVDNPIQYESGGNSSRIQIPFYPLSPERHRYFCYPGRAN